MKKIHIFYSIIFSSFSIISSILFFTTIKKEIKNENDLIHIQIKGAFKYPGIKIIKKDKTILDILNENEFFDEADLGKIDFDEKLKSNMIFYLPFKTNNLVKIKLKNITSINELTKWKINSKIAEEILKNKNNIKNYDDFLKIKGIGEITLKKLKLFLTI